MIFSKFGVPNVEPSGKFKLMEHNSEEQMNWAGGFDDTRKYLKVGETYKGLKKVRSWHTKIIISGKVFNSVCFEEVVEPSEVKGDKGIKMTFPKKLDKLSWNLSRIYSVYNFTLYDKDEVTIKKDLYSKTAKGIIKKIKRLFIEKA